MTERHGHIDNDKRVIDRITVPEAAERLGITQSAVHKRISRNQTRGRKMRMDASTSTWTHPSQSMTELLTESMTGPGACS
jgi:predicted transcriptional regulator